MLVVDDNSVNRKILARQLELAGASTDTAAGGEEALELWRKGGYDLVLADLQMPTMDGFELARRIRDSEDGRAARRARRSSPSPRARWKTRSRRAAPSAWTVSSPSRSASSSCARRSTSG